MKTLAAILIYTAITHMPFDAFLGITAGLLFGLLCVMVFVGPTPKRQPKSIAMPSNRQTATYQIQHGVKIFNYPVTEWSAA